MPRGRSVFLAVAFATLLAICAGAAWTVWNNTREAQANGLRLHERDLAIHEALGEIRSEIYLTAILARDKLLGIPDDRDYRRQFSESQRQVGKSLGNLRRLLSGGEPDELLARLEKELGSYARSTEAVLAVARPDGMKMFRERAVRRADILTLTEDIEALAVKSSSEQRTLIEEGDRNLRTSLGWIATVAVTMGAVVAGLTLFQMWKLERQSAASESELRSLSERLRTTQEHERKYLSRELHDQVGQMLTGLRMQLTALGRMKSVAGADFEAALERAKTDVEQTLQVVRNIAMLLRPSMLDDLGLSPALNWLAKEVARSSGIEIRREIDPRVDQLSDSQSTCVYRVVQEALTNAARHSQARTVDLRVAAEDGWIRVKVTDDGIGFDPALEKRKGLGLLGMEERVRELGGRLQLTSRPGSGTSLEIYLPEPSTPEKSRDDHEKGKP